MDTAVKVDTQGVVEPEPLRFLTVDRVALHGHFWHARRAPVATVIVNPATGVRADYYHRYARFLVGHGFDVLTYDYRGIGASRPDNLRHHDYRWRDWGEYDFDAALGFVRWRNAHAPIYVVGHSIGGFLPGLANRASWIDRMLTVGAQYAWWRDYDVRRRYRMFLKWHVVMPLITALVGYFPGRRLGWLEDLPRGVVYEWSFRRSRVELSYPPARRDEVRARFEALQADILAVTATDDPFATVAAVSRGLSYFRNARRELVLLQPQDLGMERIGHFDLFHSRHQDGFWRATVEWLMHGRHPWQHRTVDTTNAGTRAASGDALMGVAAADARRW